VRMRSRELDLRRYDTDKVPYAYLDVYDPLLLPFVDQEIRLLEIGIYKGGSLLLWRDYFPQGMIVGIDYKLPTGWTADERIRLFQGSQQDVAFLSRVARETAPDGFDIIIDDASHLADLTRTTFWHLFNHHLKTGGLYSIEDWGTGFFSDWPDGQAYRERARWLSALLSGLRRLRVIRRIRYPSHAFGMVGFVKELVDEQGAADLTRRLTTETPTRSSKFRNLLIAPSIVFVTKR
jgi:hypothetical protein